MAGKKASKKASKKKATKAVAAAPNRGLTVPRSNVGATVQAMIAEGATAVSSEQETAATWVVTKLA